MFGTVNCGDVGANPCVDAKTLHASSATAYLDIIAMVMIVQLFPAGCLRRQLHSLSSFVMLLQKHSIDSSEMDVKNEDLQKQEEFHLATFCAIYRMKILDISENDSQRRFSSSCLM